MNKKRNFMRVYIIFNDRIIKRIFQYLKNVNYFLKTLLKFKRLHDAESTKRFILNFTNIYPCVHDRTRATTFDRHYVFHTAWAVRKVSEINPEVHYDFSSSLYFCALLSAFRKVNFYDYRPVDLNLSGLHSGSADLINLPFQDNSIKSLSCMHVIEHIGLGRYGDQLDYNGDIRAINELKRVTADEGSLLFVVPIGKDLIMFNAHRVYSYKHILTLFSGFDLVEFSLIKDDPDGGAIIQNATPEMANDQSYGCGLFWFRKNKSNE